MTYPLGFLQSIEREPLMAIINAFFDESGKHHQHKVVALAGVVASPLKLQAFDEAWRVLLRQYGLPALHMVRAMKDGKFSPNVPAVAPEERNEALKPFADCINTNLEFGLIQSLDVEGFQQLNKSQKAQLGSPTDPYFVAFARAMVEIIDYVHIDDKLSVVMDHDDETALTCFAHYKAIRKVHDEFRKKTVALTFADDVYFPALQAADMIGYLGRLEAMRQFYRQPHNVKTILDYLVDKRPATSTLKWGVMFADKERMITLLDGKRAKAGK